MNPPRRRKNSAPEQEDKERWLITYADMITLLMAFFIMLYGMSIVNLGKFNKLAVSVRSGFGGDVIGLGRSEGHHDKPPAPLADKLPKSTFGRMAQIGTAVRTALPEKQRGNVEFTAENGVIRIRVRADDVLFPRGSAALTPQSMDTLKAIGDAIRDLPYHYRIEGHTCDLPIRGGRYANNWELSAQRATNVLLFFIRQLDFTPGALSSAAYADTYPVVPNTSEARRRKNRRIDIVLLEEPKGVATGAHSARLPPKKPDIRPRPIQLVPQTNTHLSPTQTPISDGE